MNFATAKMSTTVKDRKAENPFTTTLRRQWPCARRQVVLHHARAGHGEAGEHADGVERDQAVDLCLVHEHEGQGHARQHEDPVGEGQTMAAPGQLARQEAVAGHEARQVREAVEARVAAGVEDQHGGQLHDVEGEVAGRAGAEDGLGLLGHHRRRPDGVGDGVRPPGQQRDAEHQEGQRRAHGDERLAGVAGLGLAEAAHPVGDGLEPRERRPAVGEGAQQEDEGQPHQPAVAGRPDLPAVELVGGRQRDVVQRAERLLDEAEDDDGRQREDEEVGRDGEVAPGLADAAQVAVEQEEHHAPP